MLPTLYPQIAELGFAALIAIVFVFFVLRYFLFAGLAFGLVSLFRKSMAGRRLQPVPVTWRQVGREIGYSILTIMIFVIVASGLIALNAQFDLLKIYSDFGRHGLWWEAGAFALLFIWHDFYFYWAHRLMHAPGIYERVHRVHHLSTNPTPWASFSFHPYEAVVEIAGIILFLFLVPISAPTLALFVFFSLAYNVMGHLGYEIFPKSVLGHPVLRYLNTATSHNLHHRVFRGNYGLYTLVWDHLFGTTHKKYESAIQKHRVVRAYNENHQA